MAGDVIGSAVIEIGADATGFDSAVEKQTKGPLGKVGKTLSGALTVPLKVGAAAAGTAIATGLGVALTKGFQRLSTIDQATRKLEGLGHSGKTIGTIMDNALASVSGTAFGLGDAAGLAATLVASGIQPGLELEATLKRVADSATIAGVDLGNMGMIWAKAAAKGRIDGQTLNQMLERQIPILDILGEHVGATAEEVTKMVSQGKIDFETFSDAMESSLGGAAMSSGDTFVGAFANMQAALGRLGETLLEPAFQGMKTLFGPLTAGIDSVTDALKPLMAELGERLAPMFESLGDKMTTFFENVDVSKLLDGITGLGSALAPLAGLAVGALGPLLSGLPVVGGMFKGLTGPVGLLIGLLGSVIARSPEIRESLGTAFDAVKNSLKALEPLFPVIVDAVQDLIDVFGGVLGDVIDALVPVIESLANTVLPALVPVLGDVAKTAGMLATLLAGAFADALMMLLPVLSDLVVQLLPVLSRVLEAVIPIVLMLVQALVPLIEAVLPVLMTLIESLLPVIEALAPLLLAIVEAVIPVVETLADLLIPIIEYLLEVIMSVFPHIETVITNVMGAIQSILAAVTAAISGDWSAVWENIKAVFSKVWDAIKGILDAAGRIVKETLGKMLSAVGTWGSNVLASITGWWNRTWGSFTGWLGQLGTFFSNAWNGLVNNVRTAFTNMTTAISNGVNNAVNWVKGLKDRVLGVFSGAGNWLKDAGKNVISGLWDGLKGAWGAVADWFTDKLDWVKGLWPFSPAKHGPLAGAGNPFFMGENFVGLLADGLNSSAGLIDRAMGGLAEQMRLDGDLEGPAWALPGGIDLSNAVKDLSNGLVVPDPRIGRSPLLGTTLTAVGAPAAASIGPISIQVEVNAPASREDGMRVADEIERVLREVGVAVGSR